MNCFLEIRKTCGIKPVKTCQKIAKKFTHTLDMKISPRKVFDLMKRTGCASNVRKVYALYFNVDVHSTRQAPTRSS